MVTRSAHVLALVKGDERYVFIYDVESYARMQQQLRRFARDPLLSFTAADARFLLQMMKTDRGAI